MLQIWYQDKCYLVAQIQNYTALIQSIYSSFGEILPESIALYYLDFQENKLIIQSSDDLQLFLNQGLKDEQKNGQPLRLFVADMREFINEQKEFEEKKQSSETITNPCKLNYERQYIEECVNQELESIIPGLKQRMVTDLKEKMQFDNQEIPQLGEIIQKNRIHDEVACNGCGMNPIIGIRYNCLVCLNFNYCEQCEATENHKHPFFKIRYPTKNLKSLFLKEQKNQQNLQQWSSKKLHSIFQYLIKKFDPTFLNKISNLFTKKKEIYKIELIDNPTIFPKIITTQTKEIYVILVVKNIGNNQLPDTVNVESNTALFQSVKVPSLSPGKYCTITLTLPQQQQTGEHLIELAFTYEQDQKKETMLKHTQIIKVKDEQINKQQQYD